MCFETGNTIKDGGAKAIAEALKTNKTLERLYLSVNLIGDEGVKALAKALETNKTLTELTLGAKEGKNRITNEGLLAIAEALKSNQTLKWIRFPMGLMGESGAKLLEQVTRGRMINCDPWRET